MSGSIRKILYYENVLKLKGKTHSQLHPRDVKYWQLCRTCLTDGGSAGCAGGFVAMSSIHEVKLGVDRKILSVTEMLMAATDLQIKRSNDSLPGVICKDCFDKILALYCFKTQAKRAENVLKKLLAKLDEAGERIQMGMKPKIESPTSIDADNPISCMDAESNSTSKKDNEKVRLQQDIEIVAELKEEQFSEPEEECLVDESYLNNSKERINVSNLIYADADIAESPSPKSEKEDQNWSEDENSNGDITDEDEPPQNAPMKPLKTRKNTKHPEFLKCRICEEVFKAERELVEHVRNLHPNNRPFKCSFCERTYMKSHSLLRHTWTHEPSRYHFVCEHCGKSFMYPEFLKRHLRVHTDERPYVCGICHKRFKQSSGLKDHEAVHSDQPQYICKVCGHCLTSRKGLYTHRKSHHAENTHARGRRQIEAD